MLKEDAGAWHLKADIDPALLLGPPVIVVMPQGQAADTVALKGVPKALMGSLGPQDNVKLAAVELSIIPD
jgi:hypothetical protein